MVAETSEEVKQEKKEAEKAADAGSLEGVSIERAGGTSRVGRWEVT